MFDALLEYAFLRNALVAGLFASMVCGMVGVLVIEKKLVIMSGGIAHTSYGGVGLGYLLGFEPILGAFAFAVASAFGIGFIKRKGFTRPDVIIGMFWSLGMALGIFFIAMAKGYPPDLTSYLFGSILSVTKADLILMACLAFAVLSVTVMLFNYWKAFLFDEEFASVLGIKTAFLDYLLLLMVALSVVVLIKVVGIILSLALLCVPAAVGGMLSRTLAGRMIAAIVAGAFFCVAGLWVSYTANVASGASIVVISVICYLIVYVVCARIRNSRKTQSARREEI